jgi:hypothetical protein
MQTPRNGAAGVSAHVGSSSSTLQKGTVREPEQRTPRFTVARPLSAGSAPRSLSAPRSISRLPPGDELYFAQAFPASPPMPIHPLLRERRGSGLRSSSGTADRSPAVTSTPVGNSYSVTLLGASAGATTLASAASRFTVTAHRSNDAEVNQRFEELEALR